MRRLEKSLNHFITLQFLDISWRVFPILLRNSEIGFVRAIKTHFISTSRVASSLFTKEFFQQYGARSSGERACGFGVCSRMRAVPEQAAIHSQTGF